MVKLYRVLNLGQTSDGKFTMNSEVAGQWLDKINSYMSDIVRIQDWVKAHPSEAASIGLDKDAANLPPTGDVSTYPKLSQVMKDLKSGTSIDTSELQCVENLGAAVKAANDKISAFPGGFVEFMKSPLGIGLGAGIVALGVGLVVLS